MQHQGIGPCLAVMYERQDNSNVFKGADVLEESASRLIIDLQ